MTSLYPTHPLKLLDFSILKFAEGVNLGSEVIRFFEGRKEKRQLTNGPKASTSKGTRTFKGSCVLERRWALDLLVALDAIYL